MVGGGVAERCGWDSDRPSSTMLLRSCACAEPDPAKRRCRIATCWVVGVRREHHWRVMPCKTAAEECLAEALPVLLRRRPVPLIATVSWPRSRLHGSVEKLGVEAEAAGSMFIVLAFILSADSRQLGCLSRADPQD